MKLKGKNVTIFTKNNFRFQGVVNSCDKNFIELFENTKQKIKMIAIEQITEIEVNE
jgi:sRNA-binding regulator protein Hfq